MKFKKDEIIQLSHPLIMGKENFKFETRFFDVVEVDPNPDHASHDENVWYIESEVTFSSHVGTHIEFPFHHKEDGEDCLQYPLEYLIGEASVITCLGKKAREPITLADVQKYKDVIQKGDMIFFRTDFDQYYRTPDWEPFPYVEHEALKWLVETYEPKIIGSDASGIEVPGTSYQPNHTYCFEKGIAIVESLTNLKAIDGIRTTVFILALPMARVDSCPVRIVAIKR